MKMHHRQLITFVIMLSVLGLGLSCLRADEAERIPQGTCTERPAGEGWLDLFSGENAADWKNVTDKAGDVFSIEDGVFAAHGKKPTRYIAWMKRPFADFELHVEFKVSAGANSGLFFRTAPEDPVQGGMEIQVMDDHGAAPNKHGCGSLYDVATPMFNTALPTGQWNSYDLTCRGSQVRVVLNGWKVLDLDLAMMTEPIGKFDTPLAELPASGHIVLQNHGGDVWFRNLLLRPL